jgi:peptidoglycan/LPS O-acetylase OafA/YrhL
MILAIAVAYFRFFILGRDLPDISVENILLHIGYLIPFFDDYDWFIGVFWTLAIEFQYYLFLALFIPLLFRKKLIFRVLFFLIVLILPFFFQNEKLFPY